jgi:hypothetical protein
MFSITVFRMKKWKGCHDRKSIQMRNKHHRDLSYARGKRAISTRMCREVLRYFVPKLLDREGFGHKSVRTGLQSFDAIFRHRLGADDDRRDLRPCRRRSYRPHQAYTINFRHHDVRKDQIRRAALEQSQCLENVIGQMDFISIRSQYFIHNRTKYRIIIDDKYCRGTTITHNLQTLFQ